jgi:peptidyl-prolyl cis-trans isomerase B (cyclophilin B)
VPTNKRARAYAHRRQEKWELREAKRARARRRHRIVAASIIGTLVVATGASAVVLANQPPADVADLQDPLSDAAALPAYDAPPPPSDAEGRAWTAAVATSAGDLTVELDGASAPQAVASFLMLAGDGYFDGTTCHRLVVGQLIQCGDPTATGYGGPGYAFGPIENAPAEQVYPAGTLAMARNGGDAASQGSQFFIVLNEITVPNDSAGGYTVFGHVTDGLDALVGATAGGTVDGSPDGRPATPVTIEGVVIS